MKIYFDASFLVSLFSLDIFSIRANEAFRGKSVSPVVSDFGAAEFASAISRKVRTRALSEDDARLAFAGFDSWLAQIAGRTKTDASDMIAAEAALRRLDLNLRAPDALNIAIAQRLGAELATFDQRMADCARALGVPVAAI